MGDAVRHGACRQRPPTLLHATDLGDHLIDDIGGNTLATNPTDTTSDNRRSDSGFTQPARGTHRNYTAVILIERYWG